VRARVNGRNAACHSARKITLCKICNAAVYTVQRSLDYCSLLSRRCTEYFRLPVRVSPVLSCVRSQQPGTTRLGNGVSSGARDGSPQCRVLLWSLGTNLQSLLISANYTTAMYSERKQSNILST